jgi:RNA polymerase sigma-70 factor (ECF subfamily)
VECDDPPSDRAEADSTGALLDRACAGDIGARDTLCGDCRQIAYRLLCRRVSHPVADDLAQDAALRFFKSLNRFDLRRSSLRTWVCKIAINCLNDYFRGDKRRREVPLNSQNFAATKTEHADLLDALARLPDDLKSVLELKFFDGLSSAEIAECLDCPESTVKSRIHTAKQKLADVLGGVRKKGSQGRYRAAVSPSGESS